MDDQVDRSVQSLCRKLETFEGHLRDLKRRMCQEHGGSRAELERKTALAETALKRIKDDALAAQARMQVQAEAIALTVNGNVEAWKSNREMEKLMRRAEDAEAYAAWSLIVATRAIDEAELATLRAIAARMDFENDSTK